MNGEQTTAARTLRLASRLTSSKLAYNLLLTLLFFTICFGLGYATLNRYDPRDARGTRDSIKYYRIVVGEPQSPRDFRVQERVLVPYLAKPIYWLAQGRVGSWNAVFFALLVVNSFFCAIAALTLTSVAQRLTGDPAVALLSATLYLLNFAFINLHLSGLVDSAVVCLMMLITLAMLTRRLLWLPVIMIVGSLAKDSFLPLATLFVIIWLLVEYRGRLSSRLIILVVAMLILGLVTTSVVQYLVFGQTFARPWIVFFSGQVLRRVFSFSYLKSLLGVFISGEALYIFAWLLPLGLLRIKRMPRPWVIASLGTSLVILLLGATRDAGSNLPRPIFNVAGALLTISAAIFLAERARSANALRRSD